MPKPEALDLSWLDDWLSEREIPKGRFDSLDVDEINDLLQLSEKGEENWTRRERLRRNEIMAKVRRAHPEMDPKVIARQKKADKGERLICGATQPGGSH
jgi:hypothetical protein